MATKNLNINDRISFPKDTISMPSLPQGGLWAKTEVIGGYGDVQLNPTGKSTLSEEIFNQHNIVPIGGVSYAMEHIFGVPEKQIHIPTLKESAGIGANDSQPVTETYVTPDGTAVTTYRYGHFVQLFGVGITGTAENDITIYPCDYREHTIEIDKVNSDGLEVKGVMLPFRYTGAALDSNDNKKYFGKVQDPKTGITSYYLKKFETEAVIKHIWKTGEDMDEEILVPSSDVWENISGLNAVESFTEMILKITKKDLKEYFRDYLEQPERCRFNTIALFNGRYVNPASSDSVYGDYEDVKMFSKLCINPEYLDINKDLNIIYRVYGA